MSVKYDKIGVNYNLSRKADKYLTVRLLYNLNPKINGYYLDIGCGTGNYTSAIHAKGFNPIGMDPSEEMLNKARQNNDKIEWRFGTAEKTNLKDQSVDGIIGSLTIHHWPSLKKGFLEMHRILKSNGNIIIFTSTPKQMRGYWLNHYFPKMMENSIGQMPSFEEVELAMVEAGISISKIETYSIRPDLEDLFLYSGKRRPELYFRTDVRNGISSFSSLANREEVNTGLLKLRKDIESRKINEIIKEYEKNLGGYLFIVGKKGK